jgi:phosphoserine phosphatase RsbU/P
MRYRWKILILFLAISLVPIVVMRTISLFSLRQIGNELISKSRENRIMGFQRQIQLLINSYTTILDAERQKIDMALLLQAREVEKCLAKTVKPPVKVHFAQDYNIGVNSPADATPSAFHFRLRSNDATDMLKVSYTEQVFKLVTAANSRDFEKDIARLSAMTPMYREISDRLQGLIFWQYTILESGLMSAYPGHNGIPLDLDPREQPWYRNAMHSAGERWSAPYIDPETRRVVIAAARPIKRPNGAIAGVTALIIPVSSILDRHLLSENIPQEAEPFLIYLAKQDNTGKTGALILAGGEYLNMQRRNWRIRLGNEWLMSSDTKQFQDMLADLAGGISKLRRMPYKDKDSLWVYGVGHGQSHLVLITPYEEILKQADQAKQYVEGRVDEIVTFTTYVIFGAILLVVILAFLFSRTITRPINALEEAAKHLSRGEFDSQVNIRSRDEFGDMGKIFNSVGPRLKELYQVRNSLALAMEVQQNLLPKHDPSIEGVDIAGKSIYYDETGGDYYDFLEDEHDPSKIGIIVGDVSDHGIPSALLMTTARAFLRQRSTGPGTIRDIVSDVNRLLAKDVGTSGRFMSLFYAEIAPRERYIRWVRAGHDPALLYDPDTDAFSELSGRGLPLGAFEDTEYEETKKAITPGQIITIGTDGIWEIVNSQGVMFGKKNLKEVIRSQAKKSAKEIVSSIIEATDEFRGPVERQDDITIVIIKVQELPGEANKARPALS